MFCSPPQRIIAITHDARVARRLALFWGVYTVIIGPSPNSDQASDRHATTRLRAARATAHGSDTRCPAALVAPADPPDEAPLQVIEEAERAIEKEGWLLDREVCAPPPCVPGRPCAGQNGP